MEYYAVVAFVEEADAIGLVSASWIVRESEELLCYWPAHNTTIRAKNHEIPDVEKWGKYRIRVIDDKIGDYETAKRYCKKAEETSNMESDQEEIVGRKSKRPPRYDSTGSEADDDSETADEVQPPKKKSCRDREDSAPLLAKPSTCDVSEAHTSSSLGRPLPRTSPRKKKVNLPSPPIKVRTATKPATEKPAGSTRSPNSSDSGQAKSASLSQSPGTPRQDRMGVISNRSDSGQAKSASLSQSPGTPNQDRTGVISNRSLEFKILMKLKELEESQKEILRILKKSTSQENNPQVDTDVLDDPINSVEDFDELEEKSKDGDFSRNLVRYLGLFSGSDINGTVRRVLHQLGTNLLWSSFNLCGRRGKRGLKASPIFKTILKACLKNHPDAKERDVETAISDFLKRTPTLPGGSKSEVCNRNDALN